MSCRADSQRTNPDSSKLRPWRVDGTLTKSFLARTRDCKCTIHAVQWAFKTAQAYADMIWNRWTGEYLPQWNQRSKWSKEILRNLKKGDLLWLVDDSVKRCEYKLGRLLKIYSGDNGVVRSARVKMAHGELNRPVVKLAQEFFDGVSETAKEGRRCWRLLKSATNAIRQQEITFEAEKFRICQNSKMVKNGNF